MRVPKATIWYAKCFLNKLDPAAITSEYTRYDAGYC